MCITFRNNSEGCPKRSDRCSTAGYTRPKSWLFLDHRSKRWDAVSRFDWLDAVLMLIKCSFVAQGKKGQTRKRYPLPSKCNGFEPLGQEFWKKGRNNRNQVRLSNPFGHWQLWMTIAFRFRTWSRFRISLDSFTHAGINREREKKASIDSSSRFGASDRPIKALQIVLPSRKKKPVDREWKLKRT